MKETAVKPLKIHIFQYGVGKVHTFKSYEQACRNVIWMKSWGKFGEHFVESDLNPSGLRNITINEFIIRDEDGTVITWHQLASKYWWFGWRGDVYRKRVSKFKNWTYVPGSKQKWYRFYRSPKTTNERRQIQIAEEFGVKVRGRRLSTNLPDCWDDIHRGNAEAKNWKHYRKHQWKD